MSLLEARGFGIEFDVLHHCPPPYNAAVNQGPPQVIKLFVIWFIKCSIDPELRSLYEAPGSYLRKFGIEFDVLHHWRWMKWAFTTTAWIQPILVSNFEKHQICNDFPVVTSRLNFFLKFLTFLLIWSPSRKSVTTWRIAWNSVQIPHFENWISPWKNNVFWSGFFSWQGMVV